MKNQKYSEADLNRIYYEASKSTKNDVLVKFPFKIKGKTSRSKTTSHTLRFTNKLSNSLSELKSITELEGFISF